MTTLAWTYTAYLAMSLLITLQVGRTLYDHGLPFILECTGDLRAAIAANHLLLVGFYLVNIAFVTLTLKSGIDAENAIEGFELLSRKVGVMLLTLGTMHFVNLTVLWTVRARRQAARAH